MAIRLIPSVLALLLVAVLGRGTAVAQVFEPDLFTLDNGLEVVVISNHRAPIVTHMMWYKVGSADEVAGQSGAAHFLEHMMFKGTESLEPGEFSKIVSLQGGRQNAFTSLDYTGYFQTVASDRLELMMQHEADRMVNLVIDEAELLPERDVVLEERRSNVDNNPGAQLGEMARRIFYLNHPYGRPVIGWEHEIRELGVAELKEFYRTWYAPNNAVLVVSGDVTTEEVRRLAEEHYGWIPARAVPERNRPREPQAWAPRRVELSSPQAGRPSLSIYYPAPSYATQEGRQAYALEVLVEIMGASTGRLHRSLVVDQQLAAGAGVGYGPDNLDETHLVWWAVPRPGIDLEQLEVGLREEMARLLADGVDETEVTRARQRLIDQAIFARDDVATPARVFGRALTTGQSVEDVEDWPNRIAEVTAEDVLAAARQVLDERESVTAVLRAEPTS